MVTYGLFGIVSPLVSSARLSNVTNTLGSFVTWFARLSAGVNPILVMGVVSAGFIVDLSLSVSSRDRSCVGLMLLFPGLLKSPQLVDKLATFYLFFGGGVWGAQTEWGGISCIFCRFLVLRGGKWDIYCRIF